MRKVLSFFLLSLLTLGVQGQNIQLHYDLGHSLYSELSGRPNVTTTLEMYKGDRWGSTYLFTDIDYYTDGAAGVYWEFMREFNVSSDKRWALHLEYDGGAKTIEHTGSGNRFQHAALGGVAWNWASSDYTKTFSVRAMYKRYFTGQSRSAFHSWQVASVWGLPLADGLCTFSGFAYVWYDKEVGGHLITLSEPQFWLNLNKLRGMEEVNLSVGTEVELSNNFVYDNEGKNNKFYAIPTIVAKWTF